MRPWAVGVSVRREGDDPMDARKSACLAAVLAASAWGTAPAEGGDEGWKVTVVRHSRRDVKNLGLVTSVLHPRVARLSRELDEADELDDAASVARELLRLGLPTALDVVERYSRDHAPMTAFDRGHRVLMILGPTDGSVRQALGTEPPFEMPGDPADSLLIRALKLMPDRFVRVRTETSFSMKFGDPTILWSGVHRVPAGVLAQEREGDGVGFLARAKDRPEYDLFYYGFRDGRLDESRWVTSDVKEDQLRRWRESPWWPKEWR